MTDTYALGMAVVTSVLFGLLALIASLDNPWFSGELILLVGVFLAHSLLNPLPRPGR